MEVLLSPYRPGDSAMRHVIDDMRLGHHPAPQWEQEKQYWVIRTIVTYMAPSAELQAEAWAEHKAMRLDEPARPYQRRVSAVVAGG
jgi:hypothetical protein